jgi:hypothetical protein
MPGGVVLWLLRLPPEQKFVGSKSRLGVRPSKIVTEMTLMFRSQSYDRELQRQSRKNLQRHE